MIKVLMVALAAAQLAFAQTAPPPVQTLTITTGRGELLQFPRDVKQVAAAEPKIADVIVITPREVMVNAKEPGKTTVIVWEDGSPLRYNIDVVADNTDFENFRQSLIEQLPGASNVQVTGKGDTIVLTGTAVDAAQIRKATALAGTRAKTVTNLMKGPIDQDPKQILLEVKFASVDRTKITQVGFNLFSNNSKMPGETTTEQFQSPRFTQLSPTGNGSSVNFADLLNLFIYRPDLGIGATIKALEEQDILQMLAEPNLITEDGKTASFLAGGSFPFPVIAATSTGGAVSPVVTIQFKPYGVQLDFTPTITASGAINLKVAPEVSDLDYSNAVTIQGFLIPALTNRKAETEVVLQDGQSFAIAGLLDNRALETFDKVPLLGDIPILGQFFKSRSVKKTNTELLVLVTPHFVKPLNKDEKAKLPDFPDTFLPTVAAQKQNAPEQKPKTPKAKKDSRKDKDQNKDKAANAAEFVGPRGEQEPK